MKLMTLIAFVFSVIFFTGFCERSTTNPKEASTKNQMNQDTIIDLSKGFSIKVPQSFYINSGQGDDTQFIQIRKQDETIVMERESGVGYEDRDQFKTLKAVSQIYGEIEQLNEDQENALWLAYKKTNAQFRDISGRVILARKNEIHVLLKFSCASDALTEVREIFNTIKSK